MNALNYLLDAWSAALGRACWQGSLVVLAVWLICRMLPALPARYACWFWRLRMRQTGAAFLLRRAAAWRNGRVFRRCWGSRGWRESAGRWATCWPPHAVHGACVPAAEPSPMGPRRHGSLLNATRSAGAVRRSCWKPRAAAARWSGWPNGACI